MKPNNQLERKQKWEAKNQGYKLSPSREANFILAVENTLKLLKNKRSGRVLDIGCGFGEIDILLAPKTNFEITACDISEVAIKHAKENVKKANLGKRIKIEEKDVYDLKYPNNYFDIVLSFGYVSAATYPGAQQEIARVLKPGGILICDFINCLSCYKLFNTFRRVLKKQRIPYYVSLAGISREFKKAGLVFTNQRFFNTYPPVDMVSHPTLVLFENTVGKVFRNFLGRVRLVSFKKPKP